MDKFHLTISLTTGPGAWAYLYFSEKPVPSRAWFRSPPQKRMSQRKGLDIQIERQIPQGSGMAPVVQPSGFWTYRAQRQQDPRCFTSLTAGWVDRPGQMTGLTTTCPAGACRRPSGRTGCSDVRKIATASGGTRVRASRNQLWVSASSGGPGWSTGEMQVFLAPSRGHRSEKQ